MHRRILGLVILVSALISGCDAALGNSPLAASNVPQAWFDAPLPNSSYPLAPVQITAHGSAPGGLASFELSINGSSSTTLPSPDQGAELVTLSHTWVPEAPGTYNLSLRSLSNGGQWSAPASTVVIILGDQTVRQAQPTPTFTQAAAPTPTFTPTLPPAVAIGQIQIVSVSTDALAYGGRGCGDTQVTIQARANDPAGITVVVLFFRLSSNEGNATDFHDKAMSPAGGDLYQVTVDPASEFGLDTLNSLDDGWFQYQAVVQNKAGETKTRTQVQSDVTFAPCGGGGAPPPPPPPVLRQFPTPTQPYLPPVIH